MNWYDHIYVSVRFDILLQKKKGLMSNKYKVQKIQKSKHLVIVGRKNQV